MNAEHDDVTQRWREGLTRSAARAYEAAHGNPIPDTSRGVRWAIEPRVAATVVIALVVIGLAVTWSATASRPAPVTVVSASPSHGVSAELLVHVAGAVTHPGVVTMPPGSRVADAVATAGGFADGADQSGVNLARTVTDGEQIYIPVVGELDASTTVNLNRASAAELESLPGIGPVLADRIVADRDAHGSFATVDDLGRVSGVGPAVLAQIQPLATV